MLMPNNIWQDTWQNARPIPITSQPRLFNEAKEAHAILQYFKDLTVRGLIDLIQPAAFYTAGHLLVSKGRVFGLDR
jgi:Rab3 GTPase-activating protein catalytic subunit